MSLGLTYVNIIKLSIIKIKKLPQRLNYALFTRTLAKIK